MFYKIFDGYDYAEQMALNTFYLIACLCDLNRSMYFV